MVLIKGGELWPCEGAAPVTAWQIRLQLLKGADSAKTEPGIGICRIELPRVSSVSNTKHWGEHLSSRGITKGAVISSLISNF